LRAKSLAEVEVLVLFLDAIYLPTRPSGAKEGVLFAWGYAIDGERILLEVCLGQRERYEDWLDMGRGLARRGLRSPRLVVTDGAPGLIRALNELWPEADRQRCTVHRLTNVLAKLPKRPALHDEIRVAYWAAVADAESEGDAKQRLRAIVGRLEPDYPSAAACLAEDLPALCTHLRYALSLRRRLRSTNRTSAAAAPTASQINRGSARQLNSVTARRPLSWLASATAPGRFCRPGRAAAWCSRCSSLAAASG